MERLSTVLEGSAPLYINETVTWLQTSGPPANIVDEHSSVTAVTLLDGSSDYEFSYTISNSVTFCSDAAVVSVGYFNNAPTIDITDDHIYPDCGETTASIPFTYTGSGINQYSIVSGPTIAGITFPTDWASTGSSPALVEGLVSAGTYNIQFRRYTSVNVSCGTAYDNVQVTTSQGPTESNAGTDQILACGIAETDLIGNIPDIGTGTWSQIIGPTTVTLSDIHAPTLGISGLGNGLYCFRWLISGGPSCNPSSDDVHVLVAALDPIAVDAGDPQTVCSGTPVFMDAASPTYIFEIGTWTVNPSAGVVISDINLPNTEVNGLLEDTPYTFTWTISNGCATIPGDDVIITVNDVTGPIVSDAGAAQCLASGLTTITLDGNDPDPGTGLWTKLTGSAATITDATLYNTTVTGLTDDTYTFEWAISSGGCIPTRDTVIITIDDPVTTATATDIEVCGNTANLTGNTPGKGAGLWEQVSGNAGVTIVNPTNPTSELTGLQSGVYTFSWTITNGACSDADTISVFVTYPPGSTAVAGDDIVLCGSNSTTMDATPPTVGTGLWTIVSGPNTPNIDDVTSPTTLIENFVTGIYVFKWTVSSGGYCEPSEAEVTVTITLTADAGDDQNYCNAVTSTNLVGTTSSIGTWSQVGTTPNVATLTPTPESGNTAVASGLTTGVYTFQYDIGVTGCTSSDQVTVTLYDPASLASAGDDQEHCNVTTFTMDGNTPATGTGTWTKLFWA